MPSFGAAYNDDEIAAALIDIVNSDEKTVGGHAVMAARANAADGRRIVGNRLLDLIFPYRPFARHT